MESRLKKSLNSGSRETRNEDASRAAPEDKFISTQERKKMWSEEWTQSALPKLPSLNGWHLGVEISKGVKDHALMKEFIQAVRVADAIATP